MAAQRPPYYYHVPDEICVAVSLDPGVALARAEWGARVYYPVLDFLNAQLASLLENPSVAGSGTPLEPDFTPTLARERHKKNPASVQLQRLERGRVDPSGRAGGAPPWDSVPPWVILPRRDGGATALHFYRIGPGQTTRDSWTPDGARVVRELANVVNRGLWRQRIAGMPVAITAATPNWLFPAASNGAGYTGGGPATEPQPVPPGTPPPGEPYRFQFESPELRDLVARQRAAALADDHDPRVVVAILDTCPERGDVRRKAERTDNWLLNEVARKVAIDEPRFVLPDYHAFVDGISPGHWRERAAGISHDIPDHGLFAAGIIRDIAPTAEIHLIRVLDDTGVGDLLLLLNVLAALPSLLAPRGSGRKLAINLSLMAGLPLSAELPAHWFPRAASEPATLLRTWSAMSATFETIHTGLAAVIDWLEEQGVLVVAAAGNDARPEDIRPEPRYPARYDTVLGVAAVNAAGGPSAFSNQGDFIQIGNGVAVFGGDAGDAATQAVVGIFSQSEFPFVSSGAKNETGWAYWSGTSFATPVITAIAADVWTEHPGLSPADLITTVTRSVGAGGTLPGDSPGVLGRFASAPEPDLVCTAIAAWQAPR